MRKEIRRTTKNEDLKLGGFKLGEVRFSKSQSLSDLKHEWSGGSRFSVKVSLSCLLALYSILLDYLLHWFIKILHLIFCECINCGILLTIIWKSIVWRCCRGRTLNPPNSRVFLTVTIQIVDYKIIKVSTIPLVKPQNQTNIRAKTSCKKKGPHAFFP